MKRSRQSTVGIIVGDSPVVVSRRAQVLAQFGLRDQDVRTTAPPAPTTERLPVLHAGTITLVTGPSGAGKSSLLRAIVAARADGTFINVDEVHPLPDALVIEQFDDQPMQHVLHLLSRFGLGEVATYLRYPRELSAGQHWRLKLALAMSRASDLAKQGALSPILLCDEFASLLDRVTACGVARALRRAITTSPLAALVASAHNDLDRALEPDERVYCDFMGFG